MLHGQLSTQSSEDDDVWEVKGRGDIKHVGTFTAADDALGAVRKQVCTGNCAALCVGSGSRWFD